MEKPKQPFVVVSNIPVFIDDELDERFTEKARIELRETPELVAESLKEFKELIKAEPGLNVPLDDEYCTRFLRPCKWYPSSALALMQRHFNFNRRHSNEDFNRLLPSKYAENLISGVFNVLPHRDPDGSRILFMNAGKKWNPKAIPLINAFKVMILMVRVLSLDPKTQVGGIRVIFDLDGFSLSHVTHFTPTIAAMICDWVQRCMPCRLKSIHMVNQPIIFNMAFALFKPFLHEKIKKRIIFHGRDRASLNKYFEPEILPDNVDGKIDISDPNVGKMMATSLAEYEWLFENDAKYGYTKA